MDRTQPNRLAATPSGVGAEDAGKLLLRLMVGLLMLLHGWAKLSSGTTAIAGMLMMQGLPGALAYGVYVGEVIAPLLVIIGLWTRPAALVMAVNMLFAILLAHADDLLSIGEQGGWAIELQGFYLFSAIAVALLGPGAFSVDSVRQR